MTRVVKDLDHAVKILEETEDATWDGTIAHSEPQIIVASAIVAMHNNRQLEEIREKLDEVIDIVNKNLEA